MQENTMTASSFDEALTRDLVHERGNVNIPLMPTAPPARCDAARL
jgi:hypothetical protein